MATKAKAQQDIGEMRKGGRWLILGEDSEGAFSCEVERVEAYGDPCATIYGHWTTDDCDFTGNGAIHFDELTVWAAVRMAGAVR